MDIDLLSKMVKELLLDNDNVILPGLGSFVAEIVPSTFSDKGYTINPPYRKLYFRSKPDEGYALVDFYSSSNKVDRDIADRVIREFIDELKKVLFVKKTVVFPGLGRLRATKENTVFFVADEDLDIYPEGFALQPISLKTHVETPVEVAAAVEELKAIVDMPVEEVVSVAEPEQPNNEPELAPEPTPMPVQEPEQKPKPTPVPVREPVVDKELPPVPLASEPAHLALEPLHVTVIAKPKRRFWRTFAKTLLWIFVSTMLLLGGFVVAAHFMPDVVDQILYTPEELEIINR